MRKVLGVVVPFLAGAAGAVLAYVLGGVVVGVAVTLLAFVALAAAAFLNDARQTAPVAIPFAVAVISLFVTGNQDGTREFHAAAAQVVPVLLLALAVDGRAFRLAGAVNNDARVAFGFVAVMTLGMMVFAEAVSLHSLLTDRMRNGDIAFAGIMGGLSGVCALAFLRRG
jgi:hypothetical protein